MAETKKFKHVVKEETEIVWTVQASMDGSLILYGNGKPVAVIASDLSGRVYQSNGGHHLAFQIDPDYLT